MHVIVILHLFKSHGLIVTVLRHSARKMSAFRSDIGTLLKLTILVAKFQKIDLTLFFGYLSTE